MKTDKNLIKLSQSLRKNQTPWEWKLWYHLRGSRFKKLKFKRQVIIGKFIVDFCCHEARLIIELDGGQHKLPKIEEQDKARDNFLKTEGYRILRFNNNEVDYNIEGILDIISRTIQKS